MNVLMIGKDSTLAMDKEKVPGDSQDRHILYGKYLSKLFIVVLSKRDRRLSLKKLSDNVIVYPTSSRRFPFSFVWDAYKVGRKICRENKIDVITTQDPLLTGIVGYMLKRKFKIPLNVQLVGNYLENPFWLKESRLNHAWNFLGRFIVKRADCIRAVSSMVKDNLISKLRIPPEKIIILPMFTNISRFAQDVSYLDIKQRFSQFNDIVLFVGVLLKTKNVEALLIAAAKVIEKHPKTLFLIVGEGKEKARLMELAKKLRIEQNVKFEGKVIYEDIPSYYQACSLLVLPSKHEGWPRVINEAMACGKPVVVSDACGIRDVVSNVKCGFVFPVNRADILSEKIIYLLDHLELRGEMGERGGEYIRETQDINKNAYKYKELYEKTIELAQQRR